jgi:hypothetical protein
MSSSAPTADNHDDVAAAELKSEEEQNRNGKILAAV